MKFMHCDIVVVGGGGSGLVAGCRAANLGKKVIVLEKEKNLGGGMNMASAMRTFGSKWQKERNLPDTTMLFLRNRMDETFWRIDRKLAANAVRGTGAFFDWFCEIAPKEIIDSFHVGRHAFDDPADGPLGPQAGGNHKDNSGKTSGKMFMEVAAQKLLEYGGEILTEAVPEHIVMASGKVSGVIVKHLGETIEISCKAVILASGAWVNDPELVQKFYHRLPEAQSRRAAESLVDGLKLAEETGAMLNTGTLMVRMMGPMAMCRSRVLSNMANSAYSIYVNRLGKRYISEASQLRIGVFDSASVQLEQPDGVAYVVFDESCIRRAVADGDHQPQPQVTMPFGVSHFPDSMEEAHMDIESALGQEDGIMFQADSIPALAKQLGIDPSALQQTVDSYNQFCQEGMDWDCFKPSEWLNPIQEAPFYAIKSSPGTNGLWGGVEIDETMRAQAANGGIVDGLYVAGDLASGQFLNMAGIKKQILNDMSFALSSGYLAANAAADYVG